MNDNDGKSDTRLDDGRPITILMQSELSTTGFVL